jgi:plastocyanin
MKRLARRAAPLGIVLALVFQSPASATEVFVGIFNNVFEPESVAIKQGDTVTWQNFGTSTHTTSGDHPLNYWHSGVLSNGESFSVVFTAAGTFPYHCDLHSGMDGTVKVRLRVAPRSGPVGTIFFIKLATENPMSPFVFDVQKRDPGGVFVDWRTGVTSKSVAFDSAGMPTGTYQFRSRVRNTSTGGVSDWSRPASIQVTE